MSKISVLLCERDEMRFSAYCQERGFKKSTLIARLVRDHLDSENYAPQAALIEQSRSAKPQTKSQRVLGRSNPIKVST